MAIISFTLGEDVSSDALFRAWGSALSANFASLGLVQTADTGQVNWSTVLAPTVTNTSTGYEIWRLNDTLQGTAPALIKVAYGRENVGVPSAWFQFGTLTDGAGTLKGMQISSSVQCYGVQQVGTMANCWMAGDASGFRMCLYYSNATAASGFGINVERSKNSDGSDSGAGLIVQSYRQYQSRGSWYVPLTNIGIPRGNGHWPTNFTTVGATGTAFGGNSTFYPVTTFAGASQNPGIGAMVGHQTDFAYGSVTNLTVYGVSHPYFCVNYTQNLSQSSSYARALLRYE